VTSPDDGPDGIPGSWTPVFDDEFDGDSLSTANWHTGWLGSGITAPVGGDEQECYDPAQVSVGGGYLHLDAVARSEQCGGETRAYASGMVNTDGLHEFTSGAFEARIYLPAAPDGGVADWPAFWADGQSWPADGEMDVMEGLSGQTCFHYHDPSGGPGGCADVGPGWHVFGADWEGDTVTYYYDGHDVGSTTTDGSPEPQYLILNNAVGGAGGQTAPADMLVDYVRVWKRT
jgi:beta-glucanase (GH16 family)